MPRIPVDGVLLVMEAGYLVQLVLLLLSNCADASQLSKTLYDDLLSRSGYNRLIRPVGNTSDILTIKLGLRLTQIIDVVRVLRPVGRILYKRGG
jgi:hypothetical protein